MMTGVEPLRSERSPVELLLFSRVSGTFLKSHLLFRFHLYVFSLVSRYQIAPNTLRTFVLVKSLLYLYYFILVLLLSRAKLKTSLVLKTVSKAKKELEAVL